MCAHVHPCAHERIYHLKEAHVCTRELGGQALQMFQGLAAAHDATCVHVLVSGPFADVVAEWIYHRQRAANRSCTSSHTHSRGGSERGGRGGSNGGEGDSRGGDAGERQMCGAESVWLKVRVKVLQVILFIYIYVYIYICTYIEIYTTYTKFPPKSTPSRLYPKHAFAIIHVV